MSDVYIHGYTTKEQERLTLMQSILNRAELRELNLGGLRSILDVGCGLGELTRALRQAAGDGCVALGIELEPRQLAEAQRRSSFWDDRDRFEFRRGAAQSLPLEPHEVGTFDLAHTRFLLEHVPDPRKVVEEMARAVRLGGRLVLVDDDHEQLRLSPACGPFEEVWRLYWRSYFDRGLDPLVGRRLASLLTGAGVRPTRSSVVFYGAVCGHRLFRPMVENLIGVLEGAEGALCDSGALTPRALADALSSFRSWSELPDASIWYSLPLVEGVRDEGSGPPS